jgi:hypothetical protein
MDKNNNITPFDQLYDLLKEWAKTQLDMQVPAEQKEKTQQALTECTTNTLWINAKDLTGMTAPGKLMMESKILHQNKN